MGVNLQNNMHVKKLHKSTPLATMYECEHLRNFLMVKKMYFFNNKNWRNYLIIKNTAIISIIKIVKFF